jgi:hypothetical protein
MAPETFAEPDDDPAFLACVDRIISGLVDQHATEEVYLVRIANWFDQKWLRFSGIGRVAFHGVSIDTALDEFCQEQVTFPPFTPNRLVTQHYFCRTTRGHFEEQATAHLVHQTAREHSAKNLQRRVADFSRSAVFVWFSSHSAANRRGSVMVYTVCSRHVGAWYAAFRQDACWQLGRVKGVSRPEIESFLASPRQAADT